MAERDVEVTTPGPGNGEPAGPRDAAHRTSVPADKAGDMPSDIERLRELLFGNERRALEEARSRLADVERTQGDLPQRLPEALEAIDAGGASPRVARALARPVASALGTAVRENRQTLVDTLFPVIGPLIRKAIAEALRNLVADLNGAIESSFTLRGLKWRLEAWRAGVPYAQVVLKHRLSYRIDHVFLIERESGLVLQHASAPDLPELDADAIAGMLTAIGDFVGDSVGYGDDNTLESAQVGEYVVWVEQGPRANLACFIRGVPPVALRTLLEQRLEEIHAELDTRTDSGRPDEALAASWKESLQPLALTQAAAVDQTDASTEPAAPRWPLLLALLVGLVALTWFFASRERWESRVDALRARLHEQPGFVLTGIESKPWRSISVHGLLDPDATPPTAIIEQAGLGDAHVDFVGTGYLSTDDAIVLRRAQRLLDPPDSVQLSMKDGVLSVHGHAPVTWVAIARGRAGWVAGVRKVEWSVTTDADPVATARAAIERIAADLVDRRIAFADGTSPEDEAAAAGALDSIAGDIRRARVLAGEAKLVLALTCIGTNDEVGSEEVNLHVRMLRAHWLAERLAALGVTDTSGQPLPTGEDETSNRRSAYVRLAIETEP